MNIFKSFSVYLGASFIEKGLAFLILPVFTHYLTPDDYGMLSLITTLSVFITPVITLGSTSAISVAYFNRPTSEYSSYVSSTLLTPTLLTLFLSIFSLLFSNFLSSLLGIPKYWLIIIPLFSYLTIINSILLTDFQIKKEPVNYGIFSLSNSIINVALSLLFVIIIGMNYQGRLIGQYLSTLIFVIVAIISLVRRKVFTIKVSKEFIKDSLFFGLPILPHLLGSMMISMSDKLFINQILGKAELGIYNTGFVIGAAISMFSMAFANTIVPFSYKLFSIGDYVSKVKIVKIYWLYFSALFLLFICVSFSAPFIFDWFINKRFNSGAVYVKWIALGYFFQGCYLMFANIIYYTKRTTILFYLSIVNVVINLGLNYLLINKFGAIGAAYTICISYFIFLLLIVFTTSNYYPLPWLYFVKRIK